MGSCWAGGNFPSHGDWVSRPLPFVGTPILKLFCSQQRREKHEDRCGGVFHGPAWQWHMSVLTFCDLALIHMVTVMQEAGWEVGPLAGQRWLDFAHLPAEKQGLSLGRGDWIWLTSQLRPKASHWTEVTGSGSPPSWEAGPFTGQRWQDQFPSQQDASTDRQYEFWRTASQLYLCSDSKAWPREGLDVFVPNYFKGRSDKILVTGEINIMRILTNESN